MGQAKHYLMDKEADDEILEFLRLLLEREELTGALQGIAKQVASEGVKSMSPLQYDTVSNFIESYQKKHICDVCLNDNISSLIDYIEVADTGTCNTCQYDMEKFMRE